MSSSEVAVVKQATIHFRNGRYAEARSLYERAARKYGEAAFANSIRLCELRLARSSGGDARPVITIDAPAQQHQNPPLVTPEPKPTAEQQLKETQQLLEHYYKRCQELEHQLLDRT